MRSCKHCGLEKPLADFSSREVKGVRYWRWRCRTCYSPFNKRYYHKFKVQYRAAKQEAARKRGERRRLAALFHYSKGSMICSCCPERQIAFLTIDHIAGGGRKHTKSINGHFYLWLEKNHYPVGFQVLCMNCNFAKGQLGICPHQKES